MTQNSIILSNTLKKNSIISGKTSNSVPIIL
jgi:hypothetical protein